MSNEAWAATILTSIGLLGGFIAWLIHVAGDLAAIRENTSNLTGRIASIEVHVDNRCNCIDEKLDEHTTKLEGLRVDVTRLEGSVGHLAHQVRQARPAAS